MAALFLKPGSQAGKLGSRVHVVLALAQWLLPAGMFGSAAAFGQSSSASGGMIGTESLFGGTQPASGGLFGAAQSTPASGLPFTLHDWQSHRSVEMPVACNSQAMVLTETD